MEEKKDIIAIFKNLKSLVSLALKYDKGEIKDSTTVQNVTNSQKGNIPEGLINFISKDFSDVLDFINFYLLSKSKAAFYANVLSSLIFKFNYHQRGLFDIDMKPDPIVMSFNPLFISPDYSLSEMIGATINEIIKLIFSHPEMFAKLNKGNDPEIHKKLNLASDVHSTEIVKNDIVIGKDDTSNIIHIPNDIYNINKLKEDTDLPLSRQETFQYYYKASQKIKDSNSSGNGNIPNQQQQQSGSGNGQSQSNSQNQNNQFNSSQNSNGQGNGSSFATPQNSNGSSTHSWENSNPDDLKDKTKQLVENAYNNLSSESRGYIPGSILSQIEALMKKPELNWKQILRRYVGIIPEGHRKTKTRLNRRQPERFDLSGRLPDKTIRIVIGIDTSGSVSDDLLAKAFNEIFAILKNKKYELTIIECDAEIGRVYKAKKISDINLKITGRGGTSFIPVIEYINKHKFKDALMIYFTDGYGDYEIPKPLTYKNLWVIFGNKNNLSVKKPYGEVKELVL